MLRPGRPRISSGLHESKTLALYNAGRALLAEKDFEEISIAQLAKQAGCSVGAFYVRFPDKNAFLLFVASEIFSFAAQRLADTLADGDIKAIGNSAKVQLAVSLLIDLFSEDAFAGGVRASVKLGFSEAKYREPFDQFRNLAVRQFTEWFASSSSKSDAQVLAASKIALGTLTDIALSSRGAKAPSLAAIRGALIYLLEAATSGHLKTASKIEPEIVSKLRNKKPQSISALKKAKEGAPQNPSSKTESAKSPPISPYSRTRKV